MSLKQLMFKPKIGPAMRARNKNIEINPESVTTDRITANKSVSKMGYVEIKSEIKDEFASEETLQSIASYLGSGIDDNEELSASSVNETNRVKDEIKVGVRESPCLSQSKDEKLDTTVISDVSVWKSPKIVFKKRPGPNIATARNPGNNLENDIIIVEDCVNSRYEDDLISISSANNAECTKILEDLGRTECEKHVNLSTNKNLKWAFKRRPGPNISGITRSRKDDIKERTEIFSEVKIEVKDEKDKNENIRANEDSLFSVATFLTEISDINNKERSVFSDQKSGQRKEENQEGHFINKFRPRANPNIGTECLRTMNSLNRKDSVTMEVFKEFDSSSSINNNFIPELITSEPVRDKDKKEIVISHLSSDSSNEGSKNHHSDFYKVNDYELPEKYVDQNSLILHDRTMDDKRICRSNDIQEINKNASDLDIINELTPIILEDCDAKLDPLTITDEIVNLSIINEPEEDPLNLCVSASVPLEPEKLSNNEIFRKEVVFYTLNDDTTSYTINHLSSELEKSNNSSTNLEKISRDGKNEAKSGKDDVDGISKQLRACQRLTVKPKLKIDKLKRPSKFTVSTYGKMCFQVRQNMLKKFGNGIPDMSKMTMMDLIFYNPETSPMTYQNSCESLGDVSKNILEEAKKEKVKNEACEEVEDNERVPVPKLTLTSDGKVVVAQDSLKVKQTPNFMTGNSFPTFKKTKTTTERQTWTFEETVKFYKALKTIGSDFEMMKSVFPERSRRSLKSKFKREEKLNGRLIDKVMTLHSEYDLHSLEKELQQIEQFKEITRKIKRVIPRKKKACNGGQDKNCPLPMLPDDGNLRRKGNLKKKAKEKKNKTLNEKIISRDIIKLNKKKSPEINTESGDEAVVRINIRNDRKRKLYSKFHLDTMQKSLQRCEENNNNMCGTRRFNSNISNKSETEIGLNLHCDRIVINTSIDFENVRYSKSICYDPNNLNNPLDVNETIAH